MNSMNPEQEAARQIEDARRRLGSSRQQDEEGLSALMRALIEVNLESRKRLTRIETRVCKIAEHLDVDVK